MKKLTSMLGLLAVAAGLTAAVAMAPAPEKSTVKASATDLQWFDMDGNYIGPDTLEDKREECGTPTIDCAVYYQSLDPTGAPEGDPTVIQGDHEL
ncbi:hypothetical protein J7E50_18165 [Pedobacter sp. ISL-68]|uniref:hypothetical protein n=1 Tax=unclassified Pedobacter TaxID=2628915 RepID=UPI001BED0A79|nr:MULTISPECIES: hypothetical protein [unclassified Pedobacter]MBT2559850.1 hypothetical protein [Pedobacter sp. ISL-64]MBT2592155.1 hypothetical protein [Pedobacter sp. ISL-68]